MHTSRDPGIHEMSPIERCWMFARLRRSPVAHSAVDVGCQGPCSFLGCGIRRGRWLWEMGDGRWERCFHASCLGEESIASDSLTMPRGDARRSQDIVLPSFLHSFILSCNAFLVMVVHLLRAHPDAPLGSKVGSPRSGAGWSSSLLFLPLLCVYVCVCAFVCLLMLPHRASMLTGELAGSRSPSRQRTRRQTTGTDTGNGKQKHYRYQRAIRTADTEFGPKVQYEH
ncbi:hypothetical protein C8Q74DRAFT_524613 [Fomes fomentarius]|nr:hypothetical protein C8Q74DRAFT_524613 [Fomes fomentarius]